MSRKVSVAISLFLAAAAAWAQSPDPAPSPAARPPLMARDTNSTSRAVPRFGRNRNSGAAQAQLASRERVQEMQTALNDLHALLKQMQAKNASSRSKDPVAKANLEMWELLLAHLDKEFNQLQATLAREEFEARRTALYNQAYEKAAKEAQAANGAITGQTPPAPSTSAAPKPNQPKE
ncbi:MAG: hypothetical protein HRJ53_06700 [Acidobacteria bacterium Pan2503]|uniref:Uncharacterized protein n=1 Tax=Candidatus Acidiferrum panamense TaxID=2741543 RepID=A0A7V8NNK8_9BACT|nr:hypothetical protein [Candidatus Acidoferrum panamensis]